MNSGRLSLPSTYSESGLNSPDSPSFIGQMVPGAPCADAPVTTAESAPSWLLHHLGGDFCGLYFARGDETEDSLAQLRETLAALEVPVRLLPIFPPGSKAPAGSLIDSEQLMAEARYDARPGSFYLIRPDQHVTARWREADPQAIRGALHRALGKGLAGAEAEAEKEGTAA